MKIRRHALAIEGKGLYSDGYCRCGWAVSCDSQKEIRDKYRGHLRSTKGKAFEMISEKNAHYADYLLEKKEK